MNCRVFSRGCGVCRGHVLGGGLVQWFPDYSCVVVLELSDYSRPEIEPAITDCIVHDIIVTVIIDDDPEREASSYLDSSRKISGTVVTHEVLWSGRVYTVAYSTVWREGAPDSVVAESLLTEKYLFEVACLLS